MRRAAWWTAVVLAAGAGYRPIEGQTVAGRVDAVRDGTVRMSFAARRGVCGDGNGSTWTRRRSDMVASAGGWTCLDGPVRVSIGRAEGRVVSIRTVVGGRWSNGGPETNIGEVSATEAAHYLLSLVHDVSGRNASDAISAAAFADAVDIAPALRRLVRDDALGIESRKQSLFWLGQNDNVETKELVGLYDELAPFWLREYFVFVLSQRGDDVALNKLIDIAQHDPNHDLRKRSMFWLGQSMDPRARNFIRDVLTR